MKKYEKKKNMKNKKIQKMKKEIKSVNDIMLSVNHCQYTQFKKSIKPL